MAFAFADLLAGPIVRRVDRTIASVWVALRKPATVQLRIYDGIKPGSTTDAPLATAETDTLAVGAQLHIAVVAARFAGTSPLLPDRLYGYDIRLRDKGATGPGDGLETLGLLADGPIDGRARAALGYQVGRLPAFQLPPTDIGRLRLLTGSCRKPHSVGDDAMPELDDLLSKDNAYLDLAKRPHQLFLTGDQIYADDVPSTLLAVATTTGARLLTGTDVPTERLPFSHTIGNRSVWPIPVTTEFFPPTRRQRLVVRQGKLTAVPAGSHLLGFGEYAATYLLVWSNVLWPAGWDTAALNDRRQRATAFKASWAALRDAFDAATTLKGRKRDVAEAKLEYHRAAPLLPPSWRRIDKYLDPAARLADWGSEDVGGFQVGPPPDTTGDVSDPVPAMPPDLTAVQAALGKALATSLTPAWFAGRRETGFELDGKDLHADAILIEIRALQEFHAGLPKVRRLLANVPTYMTFDDHEVTDDWNLNGAWVTAVNGSPLGRAVLRNGLLAFGLFQAWGNDPDSFSPAPPAEGPPPPAPPGAGMLQQAGRMFLDAAGKPLSQAPADAPAATLDTLFNLGTTPTPLPQRVRWHFRIGGPGYEVLSLDTRTQRGFPTPDAPPELLSQAGVEAQIPATPVFSHGPPSEGAGLTFVVAAAPVLGFPPVEYVAQPIVNTLDRLQLTPTGPLSAAEKDYAAAGASHDPEPWTYQEHAFERLLARLAPYRRVVFVSGDVHYACCLRLDYWRYDQAAPTAPPTHTVFAQVTASAFKNQPGQTEVMLFQSGLVGTLTRLIGVPRERIGYTTAGRQPPLVPPPGTPFSRAVRAQNHAPLALFPVAALPPGTVQLYKPDFAWRLDIVRDGRPDGERLAGVPAVPPLPDATTTGAALVRGVASRHFWETVHVPARTATFLGNAGDLAVTAAGVVPTAVRFGVRHQLRRLAEVKAAPFTSYVVPLEAGDRVPATLPDAPAPS